MFGKALILLVAALALGGIYLTYSTGNTMLETEARLAEDEYEILARNAALAGLNQATQALAEDVYSNDGDFSSNISVTGSLDGFSYTAIITDVTPTPTPTGVYKRARITSTGVAPTARQDTAIFDVQAEYEIRKDGGGAEGGDGVPVALQEAVNSNCDVVLGGSVKLNASGNGDNANIHTNENISCPGNCGRYKRNKGVQGYGLTGESPDQNIGSFFNPINDLGGNRVYQADPISDDDFDAVFDVMHGYRDIADYYVAPSEDDGSLLGSFVGSVVSSLGEIDFESLAPTEDDPLVIWIGDTGGTFNINGGTYPEYTVFVVDGNVRINGNAEFGGDYADENGLSTVAFYIGGDLVKANGNAELFGQFFVNGGVTGNGTFTLNGNISTRCDGASDISLSGNYTINYGKANPALSSPDSPVDVSMSRATHSEW